MENEKKLHLYQSYCVEFIINHPVCGIFLDCGLGKTVISLTAVWLLLFDYFQVARVLVIAPKRVAEDTWSREYESGII